MRLVPGPEELESLSRRKERMVVTSSGSLSRRQSQGGSTEKSGR